jgi:hypothetical protein
MKEVGPFRKQMWTIYAQRNVDSENGTSYLYLYDCTTGPTRKPYLSPPYCFLWKVAVIEWLDVTDKLSLICSREQKKITVKK